jgi:hypothetical protein
MVDKSHAFTTRQRRVCDDYIEKLDRGVDLLHAIFLLGNESQASTVSAAEKHRSEILEPVIAEIDPYGPFTNYNLLDSYLDDIAQNRLRSNRTLFSPDYESLVVFLQRFLQDQDANNIWDALETVRINVTAQE